MMIMVIQGMDCRERNTVLTQLSTIHPSQTVTISVDHVAVPDRVERLQMLLHRSPKVLNLVVGATSEPELHFLRQQHALFCHIEGKTPLALLSQPEAFDPNDVIIGTRANALTWDEAYSECWHRQKARFQRAA
ncbi:TPA: hypothetical protein ACX6S2_003468 [Photobacterium damselae]